VLQQLAEARQEAAACEKRGQESLGRFDFNAAALLFDQARSRYEWTADSFDRLGRAASALPGIPPRLAVLARAARASARNAKALFHLATGQLLKATRNPGLAVRHFEEAGRLFRDKGPVPEQLTGFMADHCQALGRLCEGLEHIFRGGYANAKAAFQKAEVQINSVASTALPCLVEAGLFTEAEASSTRRLLAMDAAVCQLYFIYAEMLSQFSSKDYSGAARSAEQIRQHFEKSFTPNMESLDQARRGMVLGEYKTIDALGHICEGERSREQKEWSQAQEQYELAKRTWVESGEAYLSTGVDQAIASQEAAINMSSLLPQSYMRACEREHGLDEQLATLRRQQDEVMLALSQRGVIVNTYAEATASVEQHLELVQSLELSARGLLDQLQNLIERAGLPAGVAAEAKAAAAELSRSKGARFFEKLRAFCQKTATTLKPLGEVAKPILEVLKLLAVFKVGQ